MSVEDELWNIFTYYTLHGNPLDPEFMAGSQFLKLMRHCKVLDELNISAAMINVIFTKEVCKARREMERIQTTVVAGRASLSYDGFLNSLMNVSIKGYPQYETVDECFHHFLMDHILNLASRRTPYSIEAELLSSDVQSLLLYYRDSLHHIFRFYASSASKKEQSKRMLRNFKASVFDGEGRYPKAITTKVSSNSMTDSLAYGDFLKFAMDFNLSSTVILSSLEIGDIYLSSIKSHVGEERTGLLRKLSFEEFIEALIRCALVAYTKISSATTSDKIRGLFLYMWRAVNKTVPKALETRKLTSTYGGDLMKGAMLFNSKFTAAWKTDGYRDYLSPVVTVMDPARVVLNRLLLNKTVSNDGRNQNR